MAEKVKDANLQEKEVQVVHGDIYADSFRDRLTGKEIGDGGGLTKVKVSDIDSEGQSKGEAIVSDGDGGAEWHKTPLEYEVENITSISSATIEKLKAGDVVVKKTGNQRHSYRVSYKENGQGICLTYSDASVVETVSYDKVGSEWVYNSTDISHIISWYGTQAQYEALSPNYDANTTYFILEE